MEALLIGNSAIEQLVSCRRSLAQDTGLWNFSLLNCKSLSRYAEDRGLWPLGEDAIKKLWLAGIMRADSVLCDPDELGIAEDLGLEKVRETDDKVELLDARALHRREQGFGGVFAIAHPIDSFEVRFHPYRLFVLRRLFSEIKSYLPSKTQYFLFPDGLVRAAEACRSQLDERSSTVEFADAISRKNLIAELAIAAEPMTYSRIYGMERAHSPDDLESADLKREAYGVLSAKLYKSLTDNEVDRCREALCHAVASIDRNNLLHVLLRLMSGRQRQSLRDDIGAAMSFIAMAEAIRREFERTWGRQLREEDEMGYGKWMAGARKTLYGTDRIFDADAKQARDFMTSMGLDSGIKVRCYVEGDTELGAMIQTLDGIPGIQVENLKGAVVASMQKGLAFADSLKADIAAHIFSIVVIDGDRRDNIRVVQRAAERELFFGRFFVFKPDMEYENFTTDELLDVVLQSIPEEKARIESAEFREMARKTRNTGELQALLGSIGVTHSKSIEWGSKLGAFALNNPEIVGADGVRKSRKFIEVVRLALYALGAGYVRSRDSFKVDPSSGDLIAR